jgi:uncharacterized protein (TIGR02646 family)
MIRLPETSLPDNTQRQLNRYQNRIDVISDYAKRVAEAKAKFKAYNVQINPTFRSVRSVLAELCSGARRCMYCEDSCADEVEHFRPKDIYPELVFVWENYLYACGPCNGPKNNQFAVFAHSNGQFTSVARLRGAPIVPPEEGDSVLIDPHREDPLEFMELDLRDTFWFLPVGATDTIQRQRAEYTIQCLRLNERDLLPAARREAYGSYRARLREYIVWRDEGKSQSQLEGLIIALRGMQHPTVWQEMKRQGHRLPELQPLFEAAPEALDW